MKLDKAKIRIVPTESMQNNTNQDGTKRHSVFTEGHRGEYYNIDVNKLVPFYKQSRKHFDQNALQEMAETIKAHGVRQPLTIIVDKDNPSQYQVVSGERRLRAAKMAELTKVPCLIIHDYKSALEVAIIENIQREDLHPLELAKGYEQLLEEKICTSHADIAKRVGTSKSVVTELLGLLKLPQEVKEALVSKNISNRVFFRELAAMQDTTQMVEAVETYSKEKHIIASRAPSITGKKRKVLLKIVLTNDQIHIDTNHISTLPKDRKLRLLEQLSTILE